MKLFNIITEDVLNELSSNDAWERFYKDSMSHDDYDKITMGQSNVDRFTQMFLNSVRERDMSADEALSILNIFNRADEKIKNKVKSNFNNGEITMPYDVAEQVEMMEDTGILSKKDWAKKGFIKIAEDDEWIATCTTNYEASKHYFHDTPWCTASDENGRYNGYEMFKSYTTHNMNKASLVQFTSKIFDKTNNLYKIQAQLYQNGNLGEINDFFHRNLSEGGLLDVIGYSLLNEIKRAAPKLFAITQENSEKEAILHDSIEKFQKKKKEIIQKKVCAIKYALNKKAKKIKEKEDKYIDEKWNECIEQNLFLNEDFLNSISDENDVADMSGDIIDKERFNKTFYLLKRTFEENDVTLITVIQGEGTLHKIVENENNPLDLKLKQTFTSQETIRPNRFHTAYILKIDNTLRLLGVGKNPDNCSILKPSIYDTYGNIDFYKRGKEFLSISIDDKKYLIDLNNRKVIEGINCQYNKGLRHLNKIFLVNRRKCDSLLILDNEGNVILNKTDIYHFRMSYNIITYDTRDRSVTWICPKEKPSFVTYNPLNIHVMESSENFIVWYDTERGVENTSLLESPHNMIFGEWVNDCAIKAGTVWGYREYPKGTIIYNLWDDSYATENPLTGEIEDCDKYGETKKRQNI